MTDAGCPNAQELREFLAGAFAGDEASLERHLEECASCLENLKRLQIDSRLVQALQRQPEARPGSGSDPVAEALIGRLKGFAPSTISPAPDAKLAAPPSSNGEATPDRWPTVPGYAILGELGRGGMAVVYKAHHATLNRVVALKMILDSALAGPDERDRFRREAEAVARLQHPNVVQIYEVGEADGQPFFSLEYLEGGSLSDQCDGRPMTPHAAAELVERLARAMAYAHRRGIVHRDLKPANVLLAADGTPKIGDFGLAKELDSDARHTQTGAILGTPAYMAPEQAAGRARDVGPVTDVYALGAILYELLCGEAPFGGTLQNVLFNVLYEEPRRPRDRNRAIPRDLEAICLKCLEKDQHRRYDSAETLANELRRFQAGEPLLHTRSVGRAERFWRWCRRNPAVSALATAVVLSLLTGSAVSLYFGLEATRQAGHARADAEHAKNEWTRAEAEEAKARELGGKAREEERKARQVSASLALDRGLGFCEQGDVDRGMLWLVRALELLPEEMKDLEATIRANLADWRGQVRTLRMVYPHPGAVHSVGFSRDGTTVLTSGKNVNGVLFWDATTGRLLDRKLRHPGTVFHLRVSPDGRYLLTGDYAVRLWNLATGEAIGPAQSHPKAITSLEFVPDSTAAFSTSRDGTIRRWKIPSMEPDGMPPQFPEAINCAALRPDGTLVVASDAHARTWGPKTGLLSDPLWEGGATAFAVSPDGSRESQGGYSGINHWDMHQNRIVARWQTDRADAIVFSPDGHTLLAGNVNGSARVADGLTGAPLGSPLQHQGPVLGAAISPDSQWALTGSQDQTARLWALARRGPKSRFLNHPAWGNLFFHPDGKLLLGVDAPSPKPYQTWRIWDLTTGESRDTIDAEGKWVPYGYGADGQLLAKSPSHRALWSWSPATRQFVEMLALPAGDSVQLYRLSADRRTALFTTEGGVYVYDVATWKPRGPRVPCGPASFGALNAEGTKAVLANMQGEAWLLDTVRGKLTAALPHASSVTAVAWSPDQRSVLTATRNTAVFRWDAVTGKLLGQPLQHPSWHIFMAFSPDASMLLTAERDAVRLWNVTTGKPIFQPIRVTGTVQGVKFHPDGKSFAVATENEGVRLVEVPTPVEGTVERLRVWAEVITGKEMDDNGVLRVLSGKEWYERRDRLQSLGGRPDAPKSSGPRHSGPAMVYLPAEDRPAHERAIADLTRSLAAKPEDADALVRRGMALSWLERWVEAESDFRRALTIDSDNGYPWIHVASILQLRGDRAANREWCGKMLDQLAQPGGAAPDTLALLCTILPLPAEDYARPLKLVEEAEQRKLAFHRLAKGSVLFRAGRPEESLAWLTGTEPADIPLNWCFLALAHYRLGHAPEARSWLDKAGTWIAEHIPDEVSAGQNLETPIGPTPYWAWQVSMRLVYREAKERIRPSP